MSQTPFANQPVPTSSPVNTAWPSSYSPSQATGQVESTGNKENEAMMPVTQNTPSDLFKRQWAATPAASMVDINQASMAAQMFGPGPEVQDNSMMFGVRNAMTSVGNHMPMQNISTHFMEGINPTLWGTQQMAKITPDIYAKVEHLIAHFERLEAANKVRQEESDELRRTVHELQRATDEMSEMITRLQQMNLHASPEATAPDSMDQSTEHHRSFRKLLVKRVHETMTNLIAPEVPLPGEDSILPHPLKDGEATRSAPDGTRLWNPVWPQGPAQGAVNPSFLLASIRLVQTLEQNQPTKDLPAYMLVDSYLKPVVKTFFERLRNRYKEQNTPQGRERAERARHLSKIRNRKHTKATGRRSAVDKAQAQFGAQAVVGLEQLILTDWQSSEHSSAGTMTAEAFKIHRIKHIGHNKGVEVRQLQWRAKKVVRILVYLSKLLRDSQIDNALSRGGIGSRLSRFPCVVENVNQSPPGLAGKRRQRPYRGCVSQGWATATNNTDIVVEENPVNFTIFDLELSDSLFDQTELTYINAYED